MGFAIWWERGEGYIDLVLGFDAMVEMFLTFNLVLNPDVAGNIIGMMHPDIAEKFLGMMKCRLFFS